MGSPFDDIEGMQFDTMSVDTSIASVAASALMRHDILPEFTSTPKPKHQRHNSQNEHTVASPTPTTSQDKRSFSSSASPTPMTKNHKTSLSSSTLPTLSTKKDKTSLSSSAIKQKIMARAHNANSHVTLALTSLSDNTPKDLKTAETNVPKAISSTPAEKSVKTINITKRKLTGQVVLDKVMAMDNSAVSSLETDSKSLFSSQE